MSDGASMIIGYVVFFVIVAAVIGGTIFLKRMDKKDLEDSKRRAEETEEKIKSQKKRIDEIYPETVDRFKKECNVNFVEYTKSYSSVVDKSVKEVFDKSRDIIIEDSATTLKLFHEYYEDFRNRKDQEYHEDEADWLLHTIQGFVGTNTKDMGNYYNSVKGHNIIRSVFDVLEASHVEYYEKSELFTHIEKLSLRSDFRSKAEYQDKYNQDEFNKEFDAFTSNPSEYIRKKYGSEDWKGGMLAYADNADGLIALTWARAIEGLQSKNIFNKKIVYGTVDDPGINLAKSIKNINLLAVELEYGYNFVNYDRVPNSLKTKLATNIIKVALHLAVCSALYKGADEKDIECLFKSDLYIKPRRNELDDLVQEIIESQGQENFVRGLMLLLPFETYKDVVAVTDFDKKVYPTFHSERTSLYRH